MSEEPWSRGAIRIAESIAWREVDGDLVAVDTRTGEYHVLSPVGRSVWESIARGRDLEAAVDAVVSSYRVTRSRALRDTREFVSTLLERGLITLHHDSEKGVCT